MTTAALLRLARLGVNYGMGAVRLATRINYLSHPNKFTRTNARRLLEEIHAQGTFSRYYRLGRAPIMRIRPTRKIK